MAIVYHSMSIVYHSMAIVYQSRPSGFFNVNILTKLLTDLFALLFSKQNKLFAIYFPKIDQFYDPVY